MSGWRIQHRKGYVIRPDGYRVVYTVYGAHERTVVIANGHGAPQLVWKGVVDVLIRDAQVVIWDYLTQHGSDNPTRGESVGIQSHCDDLQQILEKESVVNYVMCGWSLGVQVALAQFERDRDRILGLGLIHGVSGRIMHHVMNGRSEIAFPVTRLLKATVGRYGRVPQRLLSRFARSPIFSIASERVGLVDTTHPGFGALVEAFLQLDLEAYLSVALQADEHSTDHWIHTIDVPTLVTLGLRDAITPERSARPWFEMIPDVEIESFEGSHFPMFEAPGTLTVKLRRLLKRAYEPDLT